METKKTHQHTVKLKYKKTSVGYVAQCVDIPSIIVEASTKLDMKKEIKIAIDGYFQAFPEEHELIFNKDLESDDVIVEV
jgi:predicted RNase H-like HicB family nuclease